MVLYQLFSICLLRVDLLSYKISGHLHNVTWISYNSGVEHDASRGKIILRKLFIGTAFSLQLFVPYTLLDTITILKLVETGRIFFSDKN